MATTRTGVLAPLMPEWFLHSRPTRVRPTRTPAAEVADADPNDIIAEINTAIAGGKATDDGVFTATGGGSGSATFAAATFSGDDVLVGGIWVQINGTPDNVGALPFGFIEANSATGITSMVDARTRTTHTGASGNLYAIGVAGIWARGSVVRLNRTMNASQSCSVIPWEYVITGAPVAVAEADAGRGYAVNLPAGAFQPIATAFTILPTGAPGEGARIQPGSEILYQVSSAPLHASAIEFVFDSYGVSQ